MPGYTIIIEEYGDVRYPETISAVHILRLTQARAQDARPTVEEHLGANPPRAYEVEYRQAWVGIGAADYWEEALLRIFDAVSSGAGEAIVGALIGWYIGKRKQEKRQLAEGASAPSWEGELEAQLESFKRQIAHHFKVPEDRLVLLSTQKDGDKMHAVFRDSLGNEYEAELGEYGEIN